MSGRMRLELARAIRRAGPEGPKLVLEDAMQEVKLEGVVAVVEAASPEEIGEGEFGGVGVDGGEGGVGVGVAAAGVAGAFAAFEGERLAYSMPAAPQKLAARP